MRVALAFGVVWVLATLNADVDPSPWWVDVALGLGVACVAGVVASLLIRRDIA